MFYWTLFTVRLLLLLLCSPPLRLVVRETAKLGGLRGGQHLCLIPHILNPPPSSSHDCCQAEGMNSSHQRPLFRPGPQQRQTSGVLGEVSGCLQVTYAPLPQPPPPFFYCSLCLIISLWVLIYNYMAGSWWGCKEREIHSLYSTTPISKKHFSGFLYSDTLWHNSSRIASINT